MNETNPAAASVHEPKYSEGDKKQTKAYLKEFAPAMLGYAVVLILVLRFIDSDSGTARVFILAPIIPLAGAAFAVYRSLRRADEYSRLLQYRAMALGFGAAIFASLVFGFLAIVGITPAFAGWVIFGVAMGVWGTSLGLLGIK